MKLLVFDIDGTLTDTKPVDDRSFIAAFEDEFDTSASDVDWETFTHVTDSGLLNELYETCFGRPVTQDETTRFRTRFFDYLEGELGADPSGFGEIPGAARFIEHCMGRTDLSIAFATGSWKRSAGIKLKAARIPHSDLPLATSDDHISRTDIVLTAIARSRSAFQATDFEKIVYFGDGKWDLLTTSALGIPFIGVDNRDTGRLAQLGAPHVIRHFEDTGEILDLVEII